MYALPQDQTSQSPPLGLPQNHRHQGPPQTSMVGQLKCLINYSALAKAIYMTISLNFKLLFVASI